jgi:hypothetical protein
VVDKFLGRAQVAVQTTFAALDQIAGVVHPQLHRFLMRPIFGRMGAEPSGSRAVAALATHSVHQLERLSALLGRNRQGVTSKTFLRLVRPTDVQDFSNAHGHRIGQHLISARMFVLPRPDAVLVLRNAGDLPRLNASVATTAGTPSRAVVPPRRSVLRPQ